jgi:hypothetical protein
MADDTPPVTLEAPPKNKGGRPKGSVNKPRIPRETTPEPLREPIRAEARKVRKRRGDVNPLYIDPKMIPAGVTWEWKRLTLLGQRNPGYEVSLRENGWEPVDCKQVPEMMPPGWKGAVERDGLILMERPAYLTEEARQEDIAMARQNLAAQMGQNAQTPQGTLSRDHPAVQPRARSTMEGIYIPKE